jgi:hypothetical protein
MKAERAEAGDRSPPIIELPAIAMIPYQPPDFFPMSSKVSIVSLLAELLPWKEAFTDPTRYHRRTDMRTYWMVIVYMA